MTTVLLLAAVLSLFALLARYARHDRFTGPVPHDRFRDNDTWLFRDVRRVF